MKKTFSIISLGCFRNNYDSEIVVKRFLDKGYVFKDKPDSCHTLIVNTCGFIAQAKEESLGVIKEAVELKRKGKVKELLVFGCLVKRYGRELSKFFPRVDEWQEVEDFSGKFIPRKKISPSYVDFLKICEGCLNRCSFCAIPLIKGSLRSKSKEAVIKEVKYLEKSGVKELNIIGQDITSWGKDFKKKDSLADLLKLILKETKSIRWIRLIYTHPRHFNDSLIELIAKESRICKYIDLPIQHINDRILKLMNRGITGKETAALIKKIRKKIPNCVIRTSVIVGFPTETETEFKEILKFLKDTKFERLGVFEYSREKGTPAYKMRNQVHPGTKKRRLKEVMLQQQKIAKGCAEEFVGKELDVLIERKENNTFIGRTQYDAPEVDGSVFVKKRGLKIGTFYKAKITDALEYDLIGK